MAYPRPEFRVMFRVAMFDLYHQQALAVEFGKKRHAIRVQHDAKPAAVAKQLRALADWLDQAGG